MTGLAQVFIFAFFILAVIIFSYIIYNHAINEVKREYKNRKFEEGEKLVEDLKKSFQNLEISLKTSNNNTLTINNNDSFSNLMNDVEKNIFLLEDFIQNI